MMKLIRKKNLVAKKRILSIIFEKYKGKLISYSCVLDHSKHFLVLQIKLPFFKRTRFKELTLTNSKKSHNYMKKVKFVIRQRK